jgi:hypothetical protein
MTAEETKDAATIASLTAKLAVVEKDLVEVALRNFIAAWEKLPGGRDYSVSVMQAWLVEDMKPAADRAREAIAALAAVPTREPFAFCCTSFDIDACDCVNKNHGTARRG